MSDNRAVVEIIEEPFEAGEFDAVEIDFTGMPSIVRTSFEGLPPAELNRLAWRPTRWSPGSYERQVVYQLRASFEVCFKRPTGRGIHHRDDNQDFGNGTYPPEPRRGKPRRNRKAVDALKFRTGIELREWK